MDQFEGISGSVDRAVLSLSADNNAIGRTPLHVFTFNRQAINCYKKVGFEVEATLKERYRFGNIYWDSFRMSVLNTDWEKRRNTFNNNLAVL